MTIEAPGSLEPIAGSPPGLIEVFSIFRRFEGTYFRFVQPGEISSSRAWNERAINPHCPLDNPLPIGFERASVPRVATDVEVGAPIYCDVATGEVYYLDPDDYAFLYAHPDAEVDSDEFAADPVTFFHGHVLGGGYPSLVAAVLGTDALTRVVRTGPHRGLPADSWLRLLVAAGTVPWPLPPGWQRGLHQRSASVTESPEQRSSGAPAPKREPDRGPAEEQR